MSQIRVSALAALSVFALLTSTAFAQVLFPPVSARSNPGGVQEKNSVQTCRASGGGSRVRANCELEPEPTTVRAEHQLTISIDPAPLPSAQCEAVATTEYQQRNALAHVDSTLTLADCTAASGELTFALRVRDESGEIKPLEFSETWERSDDQDVKFTADYPIGENVELVNVRVRGLRCTCADPPSEEPAQQ
jgi:hypothetical protein